MEHMFHKFHNVARNNQQFKLTTISVMQYQESHFLPLSTFRIKAYQIGDYRKYHITTTRKGNRQYQFVDKSICVYICRLRMAKAELSRVGDSTGACFETYYCRPAKRIDNQLSTYIKTEPRDWFVSPCFYRYAKQMILVIANVPCMLNKSS